MRIIYISISGNTRSFVKRLMAYSREQNKISQDNLLIEEIKEISDNTPYESENTEFFAFIPTYLEGGNGLDNGDQEILTENLRDYLEYSDNYRYCLGIVGSGNKNFNYQYCLTAKQYSEAFNFPFIADFELRGTNDDLARIYTILNNKSKN
ncbi:class Ib ribonucleoside-diphosphate reductase assembly flavoprotein NrdI [Enterococcus sp. AZ103]|uniref:class Ib ribonucleoside-diphosphate reductase assembly flavoprotein NrdI n=1 Tax=Enterococcus sp. AZ103 TaxID=2774628 RepID=UPI003F238DD8